MSFSLSIRDNNTLSRNIPESSSSADKMKPYLIMVQKNCGVLWTQTALIVDRESRCDVLVCDHGRVLQAKEDGDVPVFSLKMVLGGLQKCIQYVTALQKKMKISYTMATVYNLFQSCSSFTFQRSSFSGKKSQRHHVGHLACVVTKPLASIRLSIDASIHPLIH